MKKTLLLTLLAILSALAGFAQKNTSESYIEKFKENAIAIMHETGIPASIILGIAMHESGNGNSNLAQNFNNQFGVKGGGGGNLVKHKKVVHTAYKKYDSILESFRDFARIMTERKQFSHLAQELTQYDYKKWVMGIQKSGYASSRLWASQVLGIIHKYNLNDLDGKPEDKLPEVQEAVPNQQ